MSILVCFAGQIGSGKTSISIAVADALGCKRTSFGEFLRAEVTRQGGNPDHRETLQDLGRSYVTKGPEEFCRQVLAAGLYRADENFILDGVRHVDIYLALQRLVVPAAVKLIFLQSDDEIRKQRVIARDGSATDLVRADAHPVEADLRANLPALAATTINGAAPLDEVVRQSLAAIGRWM